MAWEKAHSCLAVQLRTEGERVRRGHPSPHQSQLQFQNNMLQGAVLLFFCQEYLTLLLHSAIRAISPVSLALEWELSEGSEG